MKNKDQYFDKDYYENGVVSGKSLYENYRWMPDKVYPAATYLKTHYGNKKILDFGCAKGFLVKALRKLDIEAYGYDISDYAIENCEPEVSEFLFNNWLDIPQVDLIVGKDVLEHIDKEHLPTVLNNIRKKCGKVIFIIPLGENGKYLIPCYHDDPSHVVIENFEWWCEVFVKNNFKIVDFTYDMKDWKNHWMDAHPKGNIIFTLETA